MNNHDMQAAWRYHDGTKNSYWSIRNNPHFLDWANRPQPFKIYPKIEPLPLPRDVPHTGVAALSAISEPVPSSRADSVPDLQDLARILSFSAGITDHKRCAGRAGRSRRAQNHFAWSVANCCQQSNERKCVRRNARTMSASARRQIAAHSGHDEQRSVRRKWPSIFGLGEKQ